MNIKLNNLLFRYKNSLGISQTVVNKLSAEFSWDENNQIAGLLLPFGSGKSTLLKLLSGLLKPEQGEIEIANGTGNILDAVYIPPHPVSLEWLSLQEQAALLELAQDDKQSFQAAADLCGLEGYENHIPGSKSIAFRIRMQIALAIMSGVNIILLDDPFSNLPVKIKDHLFADLRLILGARKIAFLYATSELSDALQITDVLYTFKDLKGTPPVKIDTTLMTRDSVKSDYSLLKEQIPSNIRF